MYMQLSIKAAGMAQDGEPLPVHLHICMHVYICMYVYMYVCTAEVRYK